MASNYPTSLDNFTNPTSNDSLNSPSHSLQHANANDAIEALEAKLGIGDSTAGSATSGYVLTAGTGGTTTWSAPSIAGLTLVKSQTIGSAISSVAVTDAFSATYDNYKVIVSNTSPSTTADLKLHLGSTTSGYYFSQYGTTWSNTFNAGSYNGNGTYLIMGTLLTNAINFEVSILSPYLSKATFANGTYVNTSYAHNTVGWINNTTSYTGFTLTPNTGTITGGTIYVYGYKI